MDCADSHRLVAGGRFSAGTVKEGASSGAGARPAAAVGAVCEPAQGRDPPALPEVEPGRYRHFKGGMYEVIGVARQSETFEALVIYRPLYGARELWARPHAQFFSSVEVAGNLQPRFAKIRD